MKIHQVSVNVTIDHSCGDDNDYHFIDDYCYKISFHEVNWNDAKSECQHDQCYSICSRKICYITIY